MKKSILYLCGWLCLALTSCQYDKLEEMFNNSPTSLNLTIKSLQNDIKSRAVSSGDAEKRLFDIYVYVFGADGNVEYQQYERLEPSKVTTYTKPITGMISGERKSVAVIANINTNAIITLNRAQLDGIKTLDELEKVVVTLEENVIERGNNFLMSGITKNINIANNAVTAVNVNLKRIDSKIRFKIEEGNNPLTGHQITFTPRDWRVVSAPHQAGLFYSEEDLCAAPETRFDSEWHKFETDEVNGITFAFYLMENRAKPKLPIPATGTYAERYALREKQDKKPNPSGPAGSVTNGNFTYAPEGGTYVEIRGRYYHKINATQEQSADVIYTIHLGGLDDNDQNDPNDYKSLRNTYYTYKVKIVDVSKILVEVESTSSGIEDEQRPGAEGDVVIANEIITLDAYNEVRSLGFNINSIGENMTWTVSTPYTNGPKSQEDRPNDYRWVFFRINQSGASNYTSNFRTYPGDDYVYGKGVDVDLDEYIAAVRSGTDKMLDVQQLVTLIKENKRRAEADNPNNLFKSLEIHFTAFINEFYYEENPNQPTQKAVDGLWKEFVNQPARVMNILSALKYSPDGESSRTTAVFSIRQSSIQTMYNINSTDSYSGWGSQMIQDVERRAFENAATAGNSAAYSDRNNGRLNSILMWRPNNADIAWDNYISTTDWSLKPDYNAAKYQCLRMNRDNNGNGQIDDDEVQWYLAAINQLTDIWIGEWSYDPSARLYAESTWDSATEKYYASSTVTKRQSSSLVGGGQYFDDPTILWAAEGSSTGILSANEQSSGWFAGDKIKNARVYYRCVRNLGLPRDAPKETLPSPLITYDEATGIMSMLHLDQRSIRGYFQEEELPVHHERNSDNKPYWLFEVNKETSGGNQYTFQTLYDAIQAGNSPCPKGWRTPNQRELALMYSRIGDDGHWGRYNNFSRTHFQYSTSRPGFAVGDGGYGNLYLLQNNEARGGVRSVRDVKRK